MIQGLKYEPSLYKQVKGLVTSVSDAGEVCVSYTHRHTHAHTHKHKHKHTPTHTHTHTYTHTHATLPPHGLSR